MENENSAGKRREITNSDKELQNHFSSQWNSVTSCTGYTKVVLFVRNVPNLPPVVNFVGKDAAPTIVHLQESNVAIDSANFVLNDNGVTKDAATTSGFAAPHVENVA